MLRKFYKIFLNSITVELRLSIQYYRIFKKWPRFENPISMNEKILKRILYEKDPNFAELADKYAVRAYVQEKIGTDFLVPLIAMYTNANELKKLEVWENIVIKPTHGAGMVEIIDQRPNTAEMEKIIQKAAGWLDTEFSKLGDEWHYSLIQPKLVVEKKITAIGEALRDYKFHRFLQKDGSYIQILQVVAERSKSGFETVFFDVKNLNKILHSPFGFQLTLSEREKECIYEIISLNKLLCPNYGYVRLDWYITKSNIYFGEITFTPGAGKSKSFEGEFGLEMGKLWVM